MPRILLFFCGCCSETKVSGQLYYGNRWNPRLGFQRFLGENCISRKCLIYKELAIFSKSLFHQTFGLRQPGFGTSSG
jgi:hypothetical protein